MKKRLKYYLLVTIPLLIALIVNFFYYPFISYSPTSPYLTINIYGEDILTQQNEFFRYRYINEIYPQGEKIILEEIERIDKINDENLKLDEIFYWLMEDWHNPNWESDNFSYIVPNGLLYSIYNRNISKVYAYNTPYENSKFRQETPNGTFYGDDPNWIAYNKVGACKELSNLFAYMAKKSGFETRTVQTLAFHQWVEIKIDGEWMYYDPWCAIEHGYYNQSDGNLTNKSKWFNKIEYFRDNCHSCAYINTYNEFPYTDATKEYNIAYIVHDLKEITNY
jgi:hypothetical protein